MTNPANDHTGLTDTFASRRYFRKFEAITGHGDLKTRGY